MTWGVPTMMDPQLPRPVFEAWARAQSTDATMLEFYEEVHEVRLVGKCGRRVAWK